MGWGIGRLAAMFLWMLSDLLRGRLPREADPFAMLVLILLALGAGVLLVALPTIDGWLGARIGTALPH